jgi:methylmalonyl-CoA/ethylmalonyl-CoA epimerase
VSIRGLSHIGVAVQSIEDKLHLYRDLLGLELEGTEEVPGQRVRVAMFRAGAVRIELLMPLDPESPVAKFLEKRGEGIHHLAFEVEDLSGTLETLRAGGVATVGEEPKPGAHGMMTGFLHPKSTSGVLIELCEQVMTP